jgi:hypothetical protein
MPPRAALNMAYAYAVKDMDSKQRREFDNDLYGFTAENLAAERELRRWAEDDESGGES